MGDPLSSSAEPVIESSTLWRLRHSPLTSLAAMFLFVIASATWLVVASTAQVWWHSTPTDIALPDHESRYVWLGVGIMNVVIVVAALVVVGRAAGRRRGTVPSVLHQVRWGVGLAGCAGAFAEFFVVRLVTAHAMATAPLGFNNSGEGAVAIGVLGSAQPVLVAVLAVLWSRLSPKVMSEQVPLERRRLAPLGLLCLGAMVITCGAFAIWSLQDGTALIVNTSVISTRSRVTNVGAWWPGLFAAMATLTVLAVAFVPGIIWRAERVSEPLVPSTDADNADALVVSAD